MTPPHLFFAAVLAVLLPTPSFACAFCLKEDKVRVCIAPKIGSTRIKNLMLALGSHPFGRQLQSSHRSPWIRELAKNAEHRSASDMSIVILREPHERLLSAFLDGNDYPSMPKNFSDFVYTRLDGEKPAGVDQHTWWHTRSAAVGCGLSYSHYDHIVRHQNATAVLTEILKRHHLWDSCCKTGWGRHGNESFDESVRPYVNQKNILKQYYSRETWDALSRSNFADMQFFPEAKDMDTFLA